MSILQLQRKPTANDPLAMKEEFIRAKYVQKAFKDPGSEAEDAQENFWNSILSADYRGILGSILLGANPNESHGHRLARSIFGKREKQAQGAATAIYGKPVDSATSGEGSDVPLHECVQVRPANVDKEGLPLARLPSAPGPAAGGEAREE